MISPAQPVDRNPAEGGWDEILSQNDDTRVFRRHLPGDGNTLVCKGPLRPAAVRQLRQETAILERLGGVAGVPHPRVGDGSPQSASTYRKLW